MRLLGRRVVVFVAAVLAVAASFLFWQQGQPRRVALQSISRLVSNLANPRGSELLDSVVIPAVVRSQTQSEQHEFISKALSDEVSPEGVLALKHHAEFGLAKSVFPNEYASWCQQAGVNADDCVAFKMEHAGIRAEVLLVREGQTYRVVRCNNVKQMAQGI
jgi:thiol:disulfide interchange protein